MIQVPGITNFCWNRKLTMLTVVTAVIFGIFGTTESAPQGNESSQSPYAVGDKNLHFVDNGSEYTLDSNKNVDIGANNTLKPGKSPVKKQKLEEKSQKSHKKNSNNDIMSENEGISNKKSRKDKHWEQQDYEEYDITDSLISLEKPSQDPGTKSKSKKTEKKNEDGGNLHNKKSLKNDRKNTIDESDHQVNKPNQQKAEDSLETKLKNVEWGRSFDELREALKETRKIELNTQKLLQNYPHPHDQVQSETYAAPSQASPTQKPHAAPYYASPSPSYYAVPYHSSPNPNSYAQNYYDSFESIPSRSLSAYQQQGLGASQYVVLGPSDGSTSLERGEDLILFY